MTSTFVHEDQYGHKFVLKSDYDKLEAERDQLRAQLQNEKDQKRDAFQNYEDELRKLRAELADAKETIERRDREIDALVHETESWAKRAVKAEAAAEVAAEVAWAAAAGLPLTEIIRRIVAAKG